MAAVVRVMAKGRIREREEERVPRPPAEERAIGTAVGEGGVRGPGL